MVLSHITLALSAREENDLTLLEFLVVGVRVELTWVVPFPTNQSFPVAVLEVANHICEREALQGDFSPLQVPFLSLESGCLEVQFVVLPSYIYIIPHFCGFIKRFSQIS